MFSIDYHIKYKLKKYTELLLDWQNNLNLISNNSKKNLWDRHIKDSLQLIDYITVKNKNIIDLGSGAGLPGIILAIADNNNHYTLIESNTKKTTFLNMVKSKLELNHVTIINDRIENQYNNVRADILIARALTNIELLLLYTLKFLSPTGQAIFLKGKSLLNEINQINDKNLLNLFAFKIFNNKINNNGKIVILKFK